MKKINSVMIGNSEGTLQVEICPAHGGMIVQIYLEGKELLHIDRSQLETAPMAAGGMPILFPFSSKTKGDQYQLNGKSYGMPMHGLVKNEVFVLEEKEKDRVLVWLENSPSWKEGYFPFDFRLEVEYHVNKNCLDLGFRITNYSKNRLPHYLGCHPFFLATDKKQTCLIQNMQVHYDYRHNQDLPMCSLENLSDRWDDVFHTPAKREFTFCNAGDGYQVRCETDENFDALVVCSWVEESMCIEPWCGLPDSIHTGRFVKWVEPGAAKEYQIKFWFQKI